MIEVSTEKATTRSSLRSNSVFRYLGWMTMIALIGAFMRYSSPYFKEHRVAVMIEDLGGSYTRAERVDSEASGHRSSSAHRITYVDLGNSRVTDGDLNLLADLPQLHQLMLENTSVTDVGLIQLKNLKNLGELNLSNTKVSDNGLKHLSEMAPLWGLYLGNPSNPSSESETSRYQSEINGSGFEHLGRLANLIYLDAVNIPIDDAALSHLRTIKGLQSLRLDGTNITDEGVAHLGALSGLIELSAAHTQLTGAEFEKLKRLHRLHDLNLEYSDVGDVGMKFISWLSALQRLNLRSTRVTDAGLVDLKASHGLDQLDLSETQVTDEGLQSIAEMSGLRQLNLNSTRTTAAGRNQLRIQLRYCHVWPDDDEAENPAR